MMRELGRTESRGRCIHLYYLLIWLARACCSLSSNTRVSKHSNDSQASSDSDSGWAALNCLAGSSATTRTLKGKAEHKLVASRTTGRLAGRQAELRSQAPLDFILLGLTSFEPSNSKFFRYKNHIRESHRWPIAAEAAAVAVALAATFQVQSV